MTCRVVESPSLHLCLTASDKINTMSMTSGKLSDNQHMHQPQAG